MKIELLHSITHDGQEYLPGLHELPDALAAQFLKYDWAAQPFVIAEAKAGAVREAPGLNLELEKPASAKAEVRSQKPEARSQETEGADAPDEGDTAQDAEAREKKGKKK